MYPFGHPCRLYCTSFGREMNKQQLHRLTYTHNIQHAPSLSLSLPVCLTVGTFPVPEPRIMAITPRAADVAAGSQAQKRVFSLDEGGLVWVCAEVPRAEGVARLSLLLSSPADTFQPRRRWRCSPVHKSVIGFLPMHSSNHGLAPFSGPQT